MTRFLHAFALTALILLVVLSLDTHLAGVLADDVADCTNGRGDTAIRGCSRIIKSGRLFGKPISKKNLAGTYSNRGLAYEDKGQLDRAMADFELAIKLDPKLANAYFNRGRVYQGKGQVDRAITDYDMAIKLDPKISVAYTYRGNVYRKKGQLDRAMADYDMVIMLDPKYAENYRNRGLAYEKLGQRDKAIADFRKAFELDPSNEKRKEPLKRLGVAP